MIDSIVFDMDGVLFDSERIYQMAWLRVGTRLKLPDIETCVKQCIGRNGRDTRAFLMETYGPEFPADQFGQDIRQAFDDIVAEEGLPKKPGVTPLLTWLKETDVKIGLATSTSYQSTARHLTNAGLTAFFSVIVTGDMVTKGKPDPEIYVKACRQLGAVPADSFAIEDSPNGIRSAHAAGLNVIMVPDLITPTPEIWPLLHRKCASLLEVKGYFEDLLNNS